MTFTSSASCLRLERTQLIWLAGGVFVSVGAYLAFSAFVFRPGFPLDDAWIHQAYARNLAEHGEWALIPGQVSAGSTSPLWTGLLALGYLLKLPHHVWAYSLGALALFLLSLTGELTMRQIAPGYTSRVPWIGIFFAFEWHLVWAAVSGMETLLHALCVLSAVYLLLSPQPRFLILGLVAGLSVWVRPDGLTLALPAFLVILLSPGGWKARLQHLLHFGLGLGLLLGLYVLFNLAISGTPMPNTFYAKQAEYASWLEYPLWRRWWTMSHQTLVGAGVALLPSLIICVLYAVRMRKLALLSPLAWYLAYLGLYAVRLPAGYQHGRYSMPAMPVYFLFGLLGLIEFKGSWFPEPVYRFVKKTWLGLILAVSLVFWLLGGRAYAEDVAYIESEMVDAARWVGENLPPEALIAAHDIGALGYFVGCDLLDLAGLVSPDVIPIIHDQNRLAEYLDARGVDYLFTFPDWYPHLVQLSSPVYISRGKFAPAMGSENIGVYRWRSP